MLAVIEPLRDSDPNNLSPAFHPLLIALLADLEAAGRPFRMIEGRRSAERQAWIWGEGRPSAVPYGRPGSIRTQKDGQPGLWPAGHLPASEAGHTRQSNHQGGNAADLWPVDETGRIFCPPSVAFVGGKRVLHPTWQLLADTARARGLRAGADWGDPDHVELHP